MCLDLYGCIRLVAFSSHARCHVRFVAVLLELFDRREWNRRRDLGRADPPLRGGDRLSTDVPRERLQVKVPRRVRSVLAFSSTTETKEQPKDFQVETIDILAPVVLPWHID